MKMKRRALLKAVAVLAAGAGTMKGGPAGAQEPSPSGELWPMHRAPPFAADCHIHIYDSRFPVAPNAMLLPPDAHVDDYRAVQRRLGTVRTILVQPSTYGTDNRCMLQALGILGADARGVAAVDSVVSDEELRRLAGAGVRGIRFNFVHAGAAATIDMLEPLSRRVDDLGWHVQLNIKGDQIVQLEPLLSRLPSPIVFDHLARIPPEAVAGRPPHDPSQRGIEPGARRVKLSCAQLVSELVPT